MKFRHLSPVLVFFAAILDQGCTTIETVSNKFDEISQPRLPPAIYAHTNSFGPQHFAPWNVPNPFDYEGKYSGESGDTAENLEIEIFGDREGVMIAGIRQVRTAGHPAVTTSIAPTRFHLEYAPVFVTTGQNGFFVTFTDPSGAVFDHPVNGIVLGELFFARKQEAVEEER